MGVMQCDRTGCEGYASYNSKGNARLLDGNYTEYYICEECWDELNHTKDGWPEEIMIYEAKKRLDEFMRTHKGARSRPLARDDVFRRICGD